MTTSQDFARALESLGIHLPGNCLKAEIHLSPDSLVTIVCEIALFECDGNNIPKGAYVIGGKGSGLGWAQTKQYKIVEIDGEHEPDATADAAIPDRA